MSQKLPHAHIARRFAFLFLLSVASIVFAETSFAGQPPKGEPIELKLRFDLEVKGPPEGGTPYFDHDGQLLVIVGRRIEAASVNARTGKSGPDLAAVGDLGTQHTFVLEKGKLLIQSDRGKEKNLVVWDTSTGKSSVIPFTNPGNGVPSLHYSANGRYVSIGDPREGKKGGPETPFRLLDTKTGKTIISMDWHNGRVLFTSDSSRVLTVDSSDRFRWFKLPTGQADGGWKFDREPSRANAKALSMSADGSVILYSGAPPKERNSIHILDGKTGAILHTFPPRTYHDSYGWVSPEGDSVVLVRTDGNGPGLAVEMFDTKGNMLAKVTAPGSGGMAGAIYQFALSWESRTVAMYERATKKLLLYDLPGGSTGPVVIRSKRDGDDKRSSVPGDAATAKAETAIRQVLKDDYAKKTPADHKALATKLLKLAAETNDDPATRYVMLRDARDLAQGIGDTTLTLQALDSLAKLYAIDGPTLQLVSLEKILASTTLPATAKLISETAAASARAASIDDELEEAVQFSQLAVDAAKKAKLPQATIDEADFNLSQAKKSRESFEVVRPALEKVFTTPDDPAANLAVGKYRCFVQNRWDEGLKHLTKGDDAALKAVAELDLKTPRTGVPEDTTVANSWWKYAQTAPPENRWAAQARTRYWYQKCLPGLTGFEKAQAEGRLGISVEGAEYRPGLMCEMSSKIPAVLKGKKVRLDPVIDFSGGEFSDAKLADLTLKWTGVIAPPRAGRYRLVAQTNDPVRVRVNGKLVIDAPGGPAKREVIVILNEQVTPFMVEFTTLNTDKHKLRLAWVAPGSNTEETIPLECFFHDKKYDNLLAP